MRHYDTIDAGPPDIRVVREADQFPRVVHIKQEKYDVYIGRGSVWGNPFVIGKDGTREEVVAKYDVWIRTQPKLMHRLGELDGMILGCFCAPLPCHGDVLVKLIKRSRLESAAPSSKG